MQTQTPMWSSACGPQDVCGQRHHAATARYLHRTLKQAGCPSVTNPFTFNPAKDPGYKQTTVRRRPRLVSGEIYGLYLYSGGGCGGAAKFISRRGLTKSWQALVVDDGDGLTSR